MAGEAGEFCVLLFWCWVKELGGKGVWVEVRKGK